VRTYRVSKPTSGIVLLALAMMAAGCGGGGGQSTAAAKKKAVTSTGNSTTGGSGGGDLGAFCAAARKQGKETLAKTPAGGESPVQLKAFGQYVKSANATLRSLAPGEIAADIRVTTRVSDTIADDYIKGREPSATVTRQLRSPDFEPAAKRAAQYMKTHCGITPSSITGG
jgi:hypothetical protein